MVRLGVLAVAVFLIAGAVPAFSSSTAPHATTHRGVALARDNRANAPLALPWQASVSPPLRVPDPASYAAKKAQAERGYQRWLRSHPSVPRPSAPSRFTSVSGNLNKPGVDSTDPANQGTPPDTTGAIGPSNYVEMVNSELAVYSNADLTTPTSTVSENTFVGDPSPCDGQIQWDQQGQRWLYAILGNCAEDFNAPNNLYFGWSKTASPSLSASNWCQYTIPTGQNLEDYPKLGHDDSQILIGTNEFGNSFTSNIYVFDKPADPSTCPSTNTEGSDAAVISINDGFSGGYTPVPANIADSSAAGYVTAIDFDQAHLDLYKVGRDIDNNNVLLSTTSVTVPAFCFPAYVPQPGTTDTLDTLDTRLTQSVAVTDPNTGQEGIWTQHTIAQGCSTNGSSSGPSVVRWYELTPGATTPTQMGTVHGPNGAFAFMGAISPSSDGNNAAIFYNSGSSTQLADFRVQDRHLHTTGGQMIEDLQLASSPYADEDFSCDPNPQDGQPCRWGDYNGASPDPSNPDLVWGTGDLTTQPVNTNPLILDPVQWGTENAAVDVTPAANYGLSVTTAGAGSGTVTNGDLSIDCPGTCSNSYAYGAAQTLTATPGAHSVFSGWTGDCSGTGTCQVPMGGPQSVTATFSLIPESLNLTTAGNGGGTVTSNPSGVSCSSSCSHNFDYGTGVQLTAAAATGSTFTGWSGACSGTGTCDVTMNQAQSVTATFTLVPETLTVGKTGAGSGTVASNVSGIACGSTCSASFNYGTSVTLIASAASNSVFTGWSGACSGTGNCIVPMTAETSVTATFGLAPETLTVTKSGSGSGTVSSTVSGITCGSTCSHAFDYGTSVTLTARPASNATFAGWSGACSGTSGCTVSMTAAKTVTAKFTKVVCVVPDVKGKKLSAAKSAITDANCSLGVVKKKTSPTVKKGKVISQSPAAGKQKADGAAVDLVVSKGK